jgi:hypothetical protein
MGALDRQLILASDRDRHLRTKTWLATLVEVCGEGRDLTLNY